ncbi:MAG: S8 family serine peptidase, partial [Acidobacteriota bacterium]
MNALVVAGVRPVQYVYRNGFIISAPAGIEKLRGTLGPEVRYLGVLQPYFKIARELRDPAVLAGAGRKQVSVLLDAAQDLNSTIVALKAIDDRMQPHPNALKEMIVGLSAGPADWKKLAALSTTLWIEPTHPAQASDERASQVIVGHHTPWDATGAGQYKAWLTNLGLATFTNEIVDIVDSGLQNTLGDQTGCLTGNAIPGGHQDLNNANFMSRLAYACAYNGLPTTNDGYYHGTFIASLIAGDPTQTGGTGMADSSGFYWGMGVAPGVKIGVSRILANNGWGPPTDVLPGILDSIGQKTVQYGAHFQNNSWNAYDTAYSLTSREMDRLVRDATGNYSNYLNALTIAVAAGNGNPSDQPVLSPGTAKNVITVGATGLPRSGLPGVCSTSIVISDIPSLSRQGLAYDINRFKPDIMAPGRSATAARTSDATAPSQKASDCATDTGLTPFQAALPSQGGAYGAGHGTSFSTALVTGAAVLTKAKLGGTPSPAMIKATLIGTAASMQGGYNYVTNSTVGWEPSRAQGWGRLD